MSIYTIVLFLHVSGAIGYFVSIGVWLFGLVSLRRARRVEQVRSIIHLIGLPGPLFGISVLLILVAGLYMTFTSWSLQTSWIAVALVSLVLVAPLGTAIIEPRRRAIDRLAREAPDGPLPQTLEQSIHDPILLTALQTIVALLFGIVFLMTTKPSLAGSLIVIVVALALGLASGLLVSRVTRARWQNVAAEANRVREPH
jgi:Zn-dependent protease with chaperone function